MSCPNKKSQPLRMTKGRERNHSIPIVFVVADFVSFVGGHSASEGGFEEGCGGGSGGSVFAEGEIVDQRRLFSGLRTFISKAHPALALLAVRKYFSGEQLALMRSAMALVMRNLVKA